MSRKKTTGSGHSKKYPTSQIQHLQQFYLQAQHLQQSGFLNEAEKLYINILKQIPEQPDCLHYLGLICMQKGDEKQAENYIKKSLEHTPNPIYHSNYGMFLGKQGRHSDAIKQYCKAVELQPDYAEAWFNLGVSLSQVGDLQEAEKAYIKATTSRKNYIQALYNLACVQEAQGKSVEASNTLHKIQEITPDSADIYYKLGLAMQYLGGSKNIHKAYDYLIKALEINPSSLEIRVAYAGLLAESNYVEAALVQYRSILELQPELESVRIDYAINLVKDEQIKPAEEELKKILNRNPGNETALAGMANIYRINGDFSRAEETYNNILNNNPQNDNALYGIAHSKKFMDKNDRILDILLQSLNRNKTSAGYYALGKIYNDIGEYDLAFEAYKCANDIKNKRVDYNHSDNSQYVDSIINVFSDDLIKEIKNCDSLSEKPVFIVGAPRSGTTLTEQIISSHPLVFGAGELKYIGQLATNRLKIHNTDKKYPERILEIDSDQIRKEAEFYLEKIHTYGFSEEVLRVTDKMPGNYLYLGYISILFPEAKLIHCQRNPLDTCLSIYFQSFQSGHQYSFDLENLGYWYLDYLRLMKHWNNILGDKILNIEYDETVNNTEATARKLIEFCGLEWNDKCLEFHKQEREVKTASQWQVRQPIYKSSLERWKRYDKHIGVLKEILSGYY